MLADHENLLSTFGKDSQSSNRKSRDTEIAIRSKRVSLNYDKQPNSRYQHVLSQRKTLMLVEKYKQPAIKQKNMSKKLKTESEIDCLNTRIRKSISGIAQTICKSKVKSTKPERFNELDPAITSIKKVLTIDRNTTHSHKNLRTYDMKKPKALINDKQNININAWISNFDQSKGHKHKNLTHKEYLKNSTKKKTNLLELNDQCPIKSSFSIDLNSDSQSAFESSRKRIMVRNCSKFNLQSSNQNRQNDRNLQNIKKQNFSKKAPQFNISIGKQMQETLKKEFKHLGQQHYIENPKFLQTKGTKNMKAVHKQLVFYEQINNKQTSPNFNKIEFPKTYAVGLVKNKFNIDKDLMGQKHHKLIQTLMTQIQLDYDLRHAKHMFSGIEEPFYANTNDQRTLSKWERLNSELKNLGLFYSVQTIKKIFLPSEQEIDPFLSVSKPHDQLTYSLIYAYETAEIHWEQKIYQKWQHWDLRDIDLTIENIDRDRKGYINVEDIAAFISMQTGREYKNRDVVLIYKRLVNGFWSRRNDQRESLANQKQKQRLKFRSLIDSLIRPF